MSSGLGGDGLAFSLFRCRVRVRYTFFLISALLGLQARSALGIGVWVVVVFVGVLLHEFGHAFAARGFGQDPEIELHGMGGHTIWTETAPLGWIPRLLISLAGPAIGFAAGVVLLAAGPFIPDTEPQALTLARYDFLWVTLAWGLFNLLPMLPFDGGQATAQILERIAGRERGGRLARQVSVGTGVLGLGASLFLREPWMAFLFGTFAYDNYQRVRGLPGVSLPR